MKFETVVLKLDQIVTEKTKLELSNREKEILETDWKDSTYEQMAIDKNLTVNYIKGHLAPLLWHRLSVALDASVNKKNWKEIVLDKLSKQAQNSGLSRINFLNSFGEDGDPEKSLGLINSPDISYFSSKNSQIGVIKKSVEDKSSRVILLSGMTGMGKTVMATKIYKEIEKENSRGFKQMYWFSFDKPVTLIILLTFLQKSLNNNETSEELNINDQISLVISLLRKNPYLLVLDQVDSLLKDQEIAGKYQEEYEDYQLFFKRVSEEYHQSCLVITSRENLAQINSLAGSNSPVRHFRLEGLSSEELKEMMQKRMIRADTEQIKTLIDYYNGNPLCLRLAVAFIAEVCDRSVAEFLELETLTCGGIDDIAKQHYEHLSEPEKNLVKFLAEADKFLTLREIITLNKSTSKLDLLGIVESLKKRSLLETSTELSQKDFEKLSEKENILLNFLSQQNDFLTLKQIMIDGKLGMSEDELLKIIQSLKKHSLLEAVTKLDSNTEKSADSYGLRKMIGLKRIIKEYVQEEIIKRQLVS